MNMKVYCESKFIKDDKTVRTEVSNTFENILVKNGYKFYINYRVLEDFNQEQYKYPEDLTENLLSNDDLKETLESFLNSLNSMYDTYSVIMSKFVLTCMLEKINGYH